MRPVPTAPTPESLQREALRQQMLLRALFRDARPAVVEGWLRGDPQRRRRGLQAYQANAAALAERALAAAFPTVAEIVGAECLAGLTRAFWRAQPPQQGDIGEWGGELPGFIAADAQLADVPYLADVARLDWAVHQASRAVDDTSAPHGVPWLVQHDPARLRLRLRAGWAVLESTQPLYAIWLAHQGASTDDGDRFAPVRAAFQAGRADALRVRRQGLAVRVELIDDATARFEAALLQRRSLAAATAAAGPGFDIEHWLTALLPLDGLAAVEPIPEELS